MGLVASQARLMLLTSRKGDIEFQVQNINNRRLRITYQTSKLATDYSDKLNNRVIDIKQDNGVFRTADNKRVVDKTIWNNLNKDTFANQTNFGKFIFDNLASYQWYMEPQNTRNNASNVDQQKTDVQAILDGWKQLRDAYKAGVLTIDTTKMTARFDSESEIIAFLDDIVTKFTTLNTSIQASNDFTANQNAFNTLNTTLNQTYQTNSNFGYFREFLDPLQSRDEEVHAQDPTWNWDGRNTPASTVAATLGVEDTDFIVATPEEIQAGVKLINNQCTNIASRLYTEDDDSATATYEAALAPLQAQDKKLELDMKNLETQRTAITTELDAVKKIIDDNIGKTFKIFA